jgi:regulator of sigma E protease
MTILATIILLGVLIFVHELGHFWAAKAVGIRVERFSIGLGPRVWGVQRGETEYVLSAIPLGGYVKMGGMDDEVMEAIEGGGDGEKRLPSDRDYDSKPIWARTLVISAGVIMNMLFAFATYTFVAGVWGEADMDTTRLGSVRAEALPPGSEALAQLPAGAHIASIGEREVAHWGDVRDGLLNAEPGPLTIRITDPALTVEIVVPGEEEGRLRIARAVGAWQEAAIGGVEPGGPADRGGLRVGDRIVEVDGEPVAHWTEFSRAIERRPETRTELVIERDGGRLSRYVTPRAVEGRDAGTGEVRTIGQIGIFAEAPGVVYTPVGFTEAVVIGWEDTRFITELILGFLRDLVTGGISPRSLGSIVTIGEASGHAAAEGLPVFLRFMALFSVNLAILNLLPIPVLDGGHLLFLAIEAVRGQALSVEQRMRWSQVGFIVIIGIMVWALGNDFLRLFGL